MNRNIYIYECVQGNINFRVFLQSHDITEFIFLGILQVSLSIFNTKGCIKTSRQNPSLKVTREKYILSLVLTYLFVMFSLGYSLAVYLRLEANHSKGTIIPNVKSKQSFLSFLVYRLGKDGNSIFRPRYSCSPKYN